MYGSPIHIRINDDEMIISNNCVLPEGWTVDTLMQAHTSVPYNLTLANVFLEPATLNTGEEVSKKYVRPANYLEQIILYMRR